MLLAFWLEHRFTQGTAARDLLKNACILGAGNLRVDAAPSIAFRQIRASADRYTTICDLAVCSRRRQFSPGARHRESAPDGGAKSSANMVDAGFIKPEQATTRGAESPARQNVNRPKPGEPVFRRLDRRELAERGIENQDVVRVVTTVERGD